MENLFELYGLVRPPGKLYEGKELIDMQLKFYKAFEFPKSYTSQWELWKLKEKYTVHSIESYDSIEASSVSGVYVLFEFFKPIICILDFETVKEYLRVVYNKHLLNVYLFDYELSFCIALTDNYKTGILECIR